MPTLHGFPPPTDAPALTAHLRHHLAAQYRAVKAWKSAEAARNNHESQRPIFPNFQGMTEAQHIVAVAAFRSAEQAYWNASIELAYVAREAFEAMARALPTVPAGPDAPRPDNCRTRTEYLAVQIKTKYFDAYPAVCAMTVDIDTGAILGRTVWMCDDAVEEAARRNER